MTYLYETFRSSRSSIITNYNKKYPARELTEEEQRPLYSYINENKNKTQNFSKDILVSCQILIDFIQKENFNKNEPIFSVMKKLPSYIEIDESLKNFFIKNSDDEDDKNSEFRKFSINTLINIYNLIEFMCWDQFKDNLNNQYQMHLKDDTKKEIKEYLDNTINENSLIKKQDIANAVRRLISRYLSGKRGDTDISEYKKLFDYIQRADLWRVDIADNDNFDTELFTIFEGMKRVVKIVIECNQEDNRCDDCLEKILQKIPNPCKDCDKCKCGLRIEHALEFYELINEEVFNANKYNENEGGDISDEEDDDGTKKSLTKREKKKEIVKEKEKEKENKKELEINTNSNNQND